MRKLILTVLLCFAALDTASPASAASPNATGTLVAAGCGLTDSVAWRNLPPIYRIDTTLDEDGHPTIVGASVIRIPQLRQPALRSPQVIETFFPTETITPHTFAVLFVLRDRRGREVANAMSPSASVDCSFIE